MFIKSLRYLILIPPLLLSVDFLPTWFIYTQIMTILYISFLKPYKVVAYLSLINLYFLYKDVGYKIIPETMVPTLSVFLLSQLILNKYKKISEAYLIFLWIGCFSIFSSGFYYLVYTIISFLLFVVLDKSHEKMNLKRIITSLYQNSYQFIMTIIITTILFFFFPRFHNFLPSANNISAGKIGYSTSVNNSTSGDLQLSSQTAFYAEINTKILPSNLYWRGRVLSRTDGYNWYYQELQPQSYEKPSFKRQITQKIKYEQDFDKDIILLQNPINILSSSINYFKINISNEYRTYGKMKKSNIVAISDFNSKYEQTLKPANLKILTNTPEFIQKDVQTFLNTIEGVEPNKIINSFKRKILKDKFSYSLTPGIMPTLKDFIANRKGFCTHFSSLLGIVLRTKGIPARLVSGFQGGSYNDLGNFYEIKSNDAHTWVEYFHKDKWYQVDPTGFVAPERVNMGGEKFLSPPLIDNLSEEKDGSIIGLLYKGKKYIDIINYKVSLFLDSYDRQTQENLSKEFNLNKKYFYILGILLIVIVVIFYYLFSFRKPKIKRHPADKLLYKFQKKCKIDLLSIPTIKEKKEILLMLNKSESHLHFIELYQEYRFGGIDHHGQMNKILSTI